MATDPLLHIKDLLPAEEILEPSSPGYEFESRVWAAQKNLQPRLVIRPKTVDSLSTLLAYLSKTSLDFAIRSQGYGSSSAKDVLISMTAFNEVKFDKEHMEVTVGAGQSWGKYYKVMEKEAPDCTVVACRTPCIGIGGSILCGGFSWLSGEFGLTSDPQNLRDATIVKLDGQVVKSAKKEEPDLLWALRGAGGCFGVVTSFTLQAYQYTQSIYAGPIVLPKSTLPEVAKKIADFTEDSHDKKLGMFLYVLKKELQKKLLKDFPKNLPKEIQTSLKGDEDKVVLHAFDGNGEEHGRGKEGFEWALTLKGAIDGTKTMNLRGVADLQDIFEDAMGKTISYWSPVALPELTKETVIRSFEWFDKVRKVGGSIGDNAYLIFEIMQKTTFNSESLKRADTAWPHPLGARHILLLGTGCAPDASERDKEEARKLIMEGYDEIFKGYDMPPLDFVPNTIEDFHDTKKIFGEHYEDLLKLKRKYDPGNRLKGPIQLNAAA